MSIKPERFLLFFGDTQLLAVLHTLLRCVWELSCISLQNMPSIWISSDDSPVLSWFPSGTFVLLNDAKQKTHTNGSSK